MKLKVFQILLIVSKLFTDGRYRSKFILIALFILCNPSTDGWAAFDKLETGAASLAMGNATVALKGSPVAIYYNPAAIRVSGTFSIALTYQNFYGLKEVSLADLIGSFALAGQPLSLAVSRFGNRHYTEIQGSLGGCYDLGNQCSLGASVQIYHLRITGYGEQTTWGANLGLLYDLLPTLTVGAQVTNINQPQLAKIREKLPQIMTIGFSFEPLEEMRLVFAIYRDIHYNADCRAGFSYRLYQGIILRSGIEDSTEIISIGFGINISKLAFDYVFRLHQILGLSHAVSVNLIL